MSKYLFLSLLIYCSGLQAKTYEMPFIEARGLILVEATLAGETGYFIFDSGSNSVIIHQAKATTEADATFHTLAGPLPAALLAHRDIQLGDYSRTIDEAYGADLSYLNQMMQAEVDIIGILGGHIFTPHAITIDNRNKRIKVETSRATAPPHTRSMPIYTDQDFPMTVIEIGGKPYNFVIDSGAKSHHVSPEVLADAHTLYRLQQDMTQVFTATGDLLSCNTANITNVAFSDSGHSTLSAIVTDFTSTSEAIGIRIDGILSLQALDSDQITIDLDRNLLYF